MGIYVGLLALIFVASLFSKRYQSQDKQNTYIIVVFCFALYAVYTLRSFTVGQDIPGYEDVYNSMDTRDYYDTYFEKGYVFLMDISNKIGLTFRGFVMIVYLIFVIPFALHVKRYSKDVLLSLLIFLCFQFFVFTMSGIRQTIATGLCFWAFSVAQRKGVKSFLLFMAILFLAFNIHKSSLVFVPVYFVIRAKLDKKLLFLYGIFGAIGYSISESLNAYMRASEITNYGVQDKLILSTTFYIIAIVALYAYIVSRREPFNVIDNNDKNCIKLSLSSFVNLVLCGLLIKLIFNGTILMRAAMYYEILVIIMIPNMLYIQKNKGISILRPFTIIMFIIFYFFGCLLPNQLNIIPFELASNLSIFK